MPKSRPPTSAAGAGRISPPASSGGSSRRPSPAISSSTVTNPSRARSRIVSCSSVTRINWSRASSCRRLRSMCTTPSSTSAASTRSRRVGCSGRSTRRTRPDILGDGHPRAAASISTSPCTSVAGAYICGEETALLNSLEGQPRRAADQATVPGRRGPLRQADHRQQRRDDLQRPVDRHQRRGRLRRHRPRHVGGDSHVFAVRPRRRSPATTRS